MSFLRPDGTEAGNNVYPSVLYLYNGDWERFLSCFEDLGTCYQMRRPDQSIDP